MATSPDSSPVCSPDSVGLAGGSLDSFGPIPIGLGAATDLFRAVKAAEGASRRTVEWYRMILVRAVRRFGGARPVDAIPAAELRAWLLELRDTLAPELIAGYVRGLRAFGNWCATEEVVAAAGFRALRRPKVPRRLIAPFSDPELRSLLAIADERERAVALVLLDTGLRPSELASLRVGDVRPDGTLHVMGKGAKERIAPIGASARRALVRYLATRTAVAVGDPLFCDRWGSGLTARGIQLAIARLGRRAAVGTRCSPHTFRHTFARGYLVNGGDVFSLQQILGHATRLRGSTPGRRRWRRSGRERRRPRCHRSGDDAAVLGSSGVVFSPTDRPIHEPRDVVDAFWR